MAGYSRIIREIKLGAIRNCNFFTTLADLNYADFRVTGPEFVCVPIQAAGFVKDHLISSSAHAQVTGVAAIGIG